MMPEGLQTIAYIAASLLFIMSLKGLSSQETARRGNIFGTIGMIIAVVITAAAVLIPGAESAVEGAAVQETPSSGNALIYLAVAIIPGCIIGAVLAARVAMTSMPQLVAILHSFVGLAAVLVGIATYLSPGKEYVGAAHVVHLVEIFIGVSRSRAV